MQVAYILNDLYKVIQIVHKALSHYNKPVIFHNMKYRYEVAFNDVDWSSQISVQLPI